MIQRFSHFSYAIAEISRYWHKIAGEQMRPYGLKGPHSVYLLELYRASDGLTSVALSERCGRDKADVCRAVALLEEKGLVARQGSTYRAVIRLTPVGEEAAQQVCIRAARAVEMGSRGLDEEKRKILYEALDCITANLRAISEDGLPEEGAR